MGQCDQAPETFQEIRAETPVFITSFCFCKIHFFSFSYIHSLIYLSIYLYLAKNLRKKHKIGFHNFNFASKRIKSQDNLHFIVITVDLSIYLSSFTNTAWSVFLDP